MYSQPTATQWPASRFFLWLRAEQELGDRIVTALAFDQDSQVLRLSLEGSTEPVAVEGIDLWNWLHTAHLPAGMHGWEVRFSRPDIDLPKGEMRMSVAMDSHGSPETYGPHYAAAEEERGW